MGDAGHRAGSKAVQTVHLVVAVVLAMAIALVSQGGGPLVASCDDTDRCETGGPGADGRR